MRSMPGRPWTGPIKCAACGHVEAKMSYRDGRRHFTVLPSKKGKMDLRKAEGGAYRLVCARCGHETLYPAEVWAGFL
jgi:ribosomal protein L37E